MALMIEVAARAITLARQSMRENPSAAMLSSAKVCIDDAIFLYNRRDYLYAARRALGAIGYCEGLLSSRFQRVAAAIRGASAVEVRA